MISLSREEVAEKLIDYNVLISKMHSSKDKKIKDLYTEILNERGIVLESYESVENNYVTMLRVYRIISFLKFFSYYEEAFFNSIDNSNLDFTQYKKNINDGGIFVSGNGSNFSNKQIILFIRNAFNHNDDKNHSKFNISKNGRFIEFHLRDVRSEREKINNPNDKKEFHIKISYDSFVEMFKIFCDNIKSAFVPVYIDKDSLDFTGPNLFDNAVIKRIYLPRKTPLSVIDELFEISDKEIHNKQELFDKVKSVLQMEEEEFVRRFPLDEYQKRTLNRMFGKHDFSFMSNQELELFIDTIIRKYIPNGIEKTPDIMNDVLLLSLFNMNKSYKDIAGSVLKITDNKEVQLLDDEKFVSSKLKTNRDRVEFNDNFSWNFFKTPYVNYLFYIFNNFDNDELRLTDSKGRLISFEGNNITDAYTLKEHIRNALTHGWYFINDRQEFEFYDNANRRVDDYNFYCHATVPVRELLSVALEKHNSNIKIDNYENNKGTKK